MDGEVWLSVAEVADLAGIARQNVRKRLNSFVSRKVPGIGHAGTRHQLLLSSLPESWQATYWARLNALPLPWQDALEAKRTVAPAPDPLPELLPAPVPPETAGAGSLAPGFLPSPGARALSSSNGGEDSAAPARLLNGAAALSPPSAALVPSVPTNDTTYIKEWQRVQLHARLALLRELDRRLLRDRPGPALDALVAQARAGALPPELQAQVPLALGRADARLSAATLRRWQASQARGLSHLAPRPRERGPLVPPWADALLKEYRRPQKPSLLFALAQLAQPGKLPAGVSAPSASAARRFLGKLDVIERYRGRLGPRALNNLRPYRQRDASGLWPLEVVSMDGHTFDAEVAHPFHGQPFRPEITSAIDISTRKLVGWSVALAESALAVLDALRHAVQSHGIPALLYVDNGSGYCNALLEQQAIGFLARLGIEKTHSRPFNSQARGAIERLHRTVWVRLAKTLPTYMGDDMDQEVRGRAYKITRQDLKKVGESRLLPTWLEFLAACERAVAEYNARPHTSLPVIRDPATGQQRHQSPDEAWADLVQQNPDCRVTVGADELADLFRPYRTGKVTRGCVRIFNNVYYAADLAAYHGETVFIGYDLHDASQVWIRDRNQRLIAVAALNGNRTDYVGQTAIEHAHAQRAKARAARLERHLEEVHRELQGSRPAIEGRLATPEEQAAAREYLAEAEPPAPPALPAPDTERPRIFRTDLELYLWVQDHPALANDQDRAYLADCLEDEDFRDLIEREARKQSRL